MSSMAIPEVVLVTGGGSGIGRACALAFARLGRRVVVTARHIEQLEETRARSADLPGEVIPRRMDLRDLDSVRDAVRFAEHEVGALGVLVNAAGINNGRPFLDVTEEVWDEAFDTNLKGLFFCTQEVVRVMRPRRAGSIVSISSMVGFNSSGGVPYGLTKWALEGLTKSLAREFTRDGIRVNAVAPGMTKTAMTHHEENAEVEAPGIPIGRYAHPSEIASAVVYLASPEASYIAGATLVVDGGHLTQSLRID